MSLVSFMCLICSEKMKSFSHSHILTFTHLAQNPTSLMRSNASASFSSLAQSEMRM